MFADFIEAINTCLPAGRLLPDSEIARYQQNCLSAERRILAVIQPESESEIISIVNSANQYRVPLYTISTGHNWGYGTSLPVTDGCSILDLSRMTKILDMDAELGLITLEPGVTQKQLSEYLQGNNLNFYVPTTGAGPTASIVGNALERGFGMTPEEDHFRAVTSVRAILADGSIYQSPFTEMGAPYAGVWKWGIGPYLDGLFAQSNMGIVTSLQISLAAKPEHTEAFVFTLKKGADLQDMLEGGKTLLNEMRGVVNGLKYLNHAQLVSTIGTDDMGMLLSKDFEWMGIGVLRCRKGMVLSARKEIRKIIGDFSSTLVFINDRRNVLLEKAFSLVPARKGKMLRAQLERAKHLMDIMNGIPRGLELRLVYQYATMSEDPPVDPIKDGVGIIWYAPVIPMKADLMLKMVDMIQDVMDTHGFPRAISLTTINEKGAMGVIPIIYRRPDGAIAAHDCYNELWQRGNALGCPTYRTNIETMPKLTNHTNITCWSMVSKIKHAIDPMNTLSPGRYAPKPN